MVKKNLDIFAETYDKENIFAKILSGEISCKKIYEDQHALAFHDINPQTQFHALVIPKGKYVSMVDFHLNANEAEIVSLFRAVGIVASKLGLEENGYRFLSNCGKNAHQEVPHFHIHIFGGQNLGRMIKPSG